LAQLNTVYEVFRAQLSLRGFSKIVGVAYWRLRDYRRAGACRRRRQQRQAQVKRWLREAARTEPSYGYRRIHQALVGQGHAVGRERVRALMGELGLQPPAPKKPRRATPAVTPPPQWPAGRKVQIDATRMTLDDGVAWVYLVEDVTSRACLAASAAHRLDQDRAAATIAQGRQLLAELGIEEPLVIQSDGGSDFRAEHFQECCQTLGEWIRCRVSVPGGLGILERLNRTFKHDFIFWHEVNTLADLQPLLPEFIVWYNQRRLHSSLGYKTPWQVLAEEVKS